LFRLLLLTLLVLPLSESKAQLRQRKTVVFGELIGRTDSNEFKLLTRNGVIPVVRGAQNKTFEIVERSQMRIVVRFTEQARRDSRTPGSVIIQFFESERKLISALILDEVDVAYLESEASAFEVQKSNNNILPLPISADKNKAKMVVYNHRNPLFKNKKQREAISYGINHDYIINRVLSAGKATIARGPFDDNSPLYNSGMKSYRHDPRLALQLLGNLGWRDKNLDGILEKKNRKFKFKLLYQKGMRLDEAISRVIKINLIKLGVDVQPIPVTKREMSQRLREGAFDAALIEQTFTEELASIQAFFGRVGKLNFMAFSNPKLENYFEFYQATDSKAQKKTLIKSMQQVINDEQPVTFLYFKWLTHYLVNVNRFENFRYMEGLNSGKIKPFEEWRTKFPTP